MSFSERDLKDKLEQMQAKIDQQIAANSSESGYKSILPQVETNPTPQMQSWINYSKAWFNNLPKVAKAAVTLGGVWLGFSVLGAILHIVSSILSIGIIGLILYIGYRWFNSSSSSDGNE